MKRNYELAGMSCGGCVANVKNALLQVPDVTAVDVALHPQRAMITMSKSVAIDSLQALLGKSGPYTENFLQTSRIG